MPTYTYQCKACDHKFNVFHAISAKPRVRCAECGGACKRLIGTGAGIIFKGSGFYETDYKRNGGKTTGAAPESKTESKTAGSGSETKTEGKGGAKGQSKPGSKSKSSTD